MIEKTCFLILLPILWLSCSSQHTPTIPEHIKGLDSLTVYSVDTEPMLELHLDRELSFGSGDQALIAKVGGFDVDKKGRVFIADGGLRTVHVFGPDGSYVTRLGREGRGPGEFVFTPFLDIISNRLYAYDVMSRIMNIYSLDSLMLSHSLNLNSKNQNTIKEIAGFFPGLIFPISNNIFLVGFRSQVRKPKLPGQKIDKSRLYYLIDEKGDIISDKVFEHRGEIVLTATIDGRIQLASNFPFMGKSLIAISSENYIFSAWSEDFLIKKYNSKGKYQQAFYYPYKNIPLTKEAAMNSQERTGVLQGAGEYRQRVIQQNALPETWPALNSMLVDDKNRLWVSTIAQDFNVYQWWVLDASDGHLLARFTWPRDKPIEVVQGGKLYTRETDKESGLEEIVRYDITMK